MADGGFFGGIVGGFAGARAQALEQQKQDFLNQTKLTEQTTQQIDATLQQIGNLAKAYSDSGKDPSVLWQNPAVQTMVESAQRLAVGIGMDPARIAAMAQSATLRPPLEDANTKPTVVPPGGSLVGSKGDILYSSEGLTGAPKIVGGKPVENTNLTAPENTITGISVTPLPNNPPPVAPSVPGPVTSVSPPVQQAALRPGALPDQNAAPQAAPTGPTFPPNVQPGQDAINYGIAKNITGPEFVKAVPLPFRPTLTGLLDYKVNPDALSKRLDKASGQSEYTRFLGWAHQASNGEYDPKYYKPMQAAIKEFTSGGTQSPASQITFGNTAIQHAGTIADAIDRMAAVPGLLDKIAKSNTSVASYAANALKNVAVRGTSEGQALQSFLTARNRFAEEVTKFYAGSQGAEGDRERTINTLDAAKSAGELYSALNTETELLNGKVNALQDRWKTAIAGPRMGDILFRNTIPDFPIIQEKSAQALDRISKGYFALKGGTNPGALPGNVVDFQTYFGTK